MEKRDHPNLLGLAVLCAAIGGLMLALGVYDAVANARLPDAMSATTVIVLIGLALAAYRAHRRLARMTPEQRDAHWRAFDARHSENLDRLVDAYVRRGKDGIG